MIGNPIPTFSVFSPMGVMSAISSFAFFMRRGDSTGGGGPGRSDGGATGGASGALGH